MLNRGLKQGVFIVKLIIINLLFIFVTRNVNNYFIFKHMYILLIIYLFRFNIFPERRKLYGGVNTFVRFRPWRKNDF